MVVDEAGPISHTYDALKEAHDPRDFFANFTRAQEQQPTHIVGNPLWPRIQGGHTGIWSDWEELERLSRSHEEHIDYYSAPFTVSRRAGIVNLDSEKEEEFRKLADAWRRQTRLSSRIEKKVMHPAYQRIIGMGPKALPLILREMEQRPGHWYWALRAISGEDPAGDCQSFSEAREAWLRWGRERGYLEGAI